MAGLRVHFVFPAELVGRVDAALVDGESRGEFVRRAVEQALGQPLSNVESPAPAEQPASDYVCPQCGPAPEGPDEHAVRAHTWPAEPPSYSGPKDVYRGPEVEALSRADVFRRAGSGEAKRDVRPVPKKGEK